MEPAPQNPDRAADRQRELISGAWEQVADARARAEAEGGSSSVDLGGGADAGLPSLSSDSFTGYEIVREIHRGKRHARRAAFPSDVELASGQVRLGESTHSRQQN